MCLDMRPESPVETCCDGFTCVCAVVCMRAAVCVRTHTIISVPAVPGGAWVVWVHAVQQHGVQHRPPPNTSNFARPPKKYPWLEEV
jgi:hypothetical protein